jgi:hypothetical protein
MALNKVDISMIEDVGGANNLVKLDANAKIPAGTGANLLNKPGPLTSASDPAIDSNKTLGTEWLNSTSGEMYVCTDATAGANVWTNVGAGSGDIENTSWLGGRGIIAGGESNAGTKSNAIDYITIATAGNGTDFGDLLSTRSSPAGMTGNSGARGVFGGDQWGNIIDYITIGTLGNSTDFGDRTNSARNCAGCSNGVRGVMSGGHIQSPSADTNVMDYITIATPGNATDFGDATVATEARAGLGNSTRGIIAGGYQGLNPIDYITIASVGNALDFGDLTVGRNGFGGCGSTTRGVFMGSSNPNANTIDYITIGTLGNAVDFGDMTATTRFNTATSSNTRAVSAGAYPQENRMEYVTIATVGNAIDFGDLISASRGVFPGSCSGD